jgi:predicted DNA-binding transcriptional regulator AlpA
MINQASAASRPSLEPLLMIEDLERLLRVNRRTIARLCKRGQIPPAIKVGNGNRWKMEDIVEAIEQMKHRPSKVGKQASEVVSVS